MPALAPLLARPAIDGPARRPPDRQAAPESDGSLWRRAL